MAQLVGVSSHKTERMQVQSPTGACARGNKLLFLSHMDISLPLSPALPLSLKSISMSLGKDTKNKKEFTNSLFATRTYFFIATLQHNNERPNSSHELLTQIAGLSAT